MNPKKPTTHDKQPLIGENIDIAWAETGRDTLDDDVSLDRCKGSRCYTEADHDKF